MLWVVFSRARRLVISKTRWWRSWLEQKSLLVSSLLQSLLFKNSTRGHIKCPSRAVFTFSWRSRARRYRGVGVEFFRSSFFHVILPPHSGVAPSIGIYTHATNRDEGKDTRAHVAVKMDVKRWRDDDNIARVLSRCVCSSAVFSARAPSMYIT